VSKTAAYWCIWLKPAIVVTGERLRHYLQRLERNLPGTRSAVVLGIGRFIMVIFGVQRMSAQIDPVRISVTGFRDSVLFSGLGLTSAGI
jgi:hypothetical protein